VSRNGEHRQLILNPATGHANFPDSPVQPGKRRKTPVQVPRRPNETLQVIDSISAPAAEQRNYGGIVGIQDKAAIRSQWLSFDLTKRPSSDGGLHGRPRCLMNWCSRRETNSSFPLYEGGVLPLNDGSAGGPVRTRTETWRLKRPLCSRLHHEPGVRPRIRTETEPLLRRCPLPNWGSRTELVIPPGIEPGSAASESAALSIGPRDRAPARIRTRSSRLEAGSGVQATEAKMAGTEGLEPPLFPDS
jgi:hypothetical protein